MSYGVPNRQIAEEAADWAVRLDAAPLDRAERRKLAQWLAASPVHVDELLYAASILGGLAQVDADRRLSIDDLLAAQAPDVVPLFAEALHLRASNHEVAESSGSRPTRRSAAGRTRWMAIAASLLLLLVSAAFFGRSLWDPSSRVAAVAYETVTGEQRSIALEDGSIVHMNTSSSMRVSLSGKERRIDLLSGEALFEVSHDPARPFRVYAGDTMTQAVGTKFNVKRNEAGVHVVVVEGKVLVRNDSEARFKGSEGARGAPRSLDEGTNEVLVVAGYRADVAEPFAVPKVSAADIAEVALWRARQLSFENQTLAAIASEFNRYNRTQMVVADSRLANTRFSGEFSSNDPESFLAFLKLTPGVQIDSSDPDRIILTLHKP